MVDVTNLKYLPVPQGPYATWPDEILRLENGWWPTGGAVDPANDSGIMNWQALLLAERTEFLKHALGGIGDVAFDVASLNTIGRSGLFNYADGVTGNPLAGTGGRVVHFEGESDASQVAVTATGRMFWRGRTAANWSSWAEAMSLTAGGDIDGDLDVAGQLSLSGTGRVEGPVDVEGVSAVIRFLSGGGAVDPNLRWLLDNVLTWTLRQEADGSLNFVRSPGAPDHNAAIKINGRKIWTEPPGTAQALTAAGYRRLPGGLILQWSRSVNASNNTELSFPIAFPHQVLALVFGDYNDTPNAVQADVLGYRQLSRTGFTATAYNADGDENTNTTFNYMALGH